ncbi:hypothetical protein [Waddlia chondrophila]|uniref:Uncharacterized protein n=3 Tax=Waddlia chondrophila TaxID=71667 RepID=D6YV01_WADCW|nr:hypothetical protein [Waddlia chondrophila]ADI37962.1 hypothetical protein wcw_0594 [Waddlia chondrophila WSU 86-1044]
MTVNSIFGGERNFDQLSYQEMMDCEIDKGVKISDVILVMSKANHAGRFFTQLGFFFKGKGWVSPDMLKNLSINDLIQIRQICKKTIDLSGKIQEKANVKKQKKIMQQVAVLGTATLTEVSQREESLSDFLKDIAEVSPKVLHASPKLSALYSSYLQMVNQNQEESDLKGFSHYLAKKEAEHNFSKLEEFDIHIGRNQLIGNQKEEENWQQKMKDYLLALMTPYKDQEGAKKLFEESPEMKEAYEAFKEECYDAIDKEHGILCKSDYQKILEKKENAVKTASSAEAKKDAEKELEYIRKQIEKLPEKRSDDQRSISKFKRRNEYPFYDVFLNQIIEKRIVGVPVQSNEGKWLEGLPEQLNFCSDLYKKAFENLGIMISLKNSNIRDSERKQFQYIKVLVEDPRFQLSAKKFLENFLKNEMNYQELYSKYAKNFDQLKKNYEDLIFKEKGIKPPDTYSRNFASALYLAAALHLSADELEKFGSRMENLEKTVSGRDEASNFIATLASGVRWPKKVGESDPYAD